MTNRRTNRRIAIFAIVLVGAVLRLPGLFTDFWLDEIWSYDIAQGNGTAHIDNNHLLNTALIKLTGANAPVWAYRIPAMTFGIGSIAMAAWIMRRRGPAEAIVASLLIAFSFPFVFYSSEARGYSAAAFFALTALAAMLDNAENPTLTSALLFNSACVLGLFSHLTFIHFYFAAMCFTIVTSRRNVLHWLRLNALPILTCLGLYYFFVRGITIGGAAERKPLDVLIESLSAPLGGPANGPLAIALGCVSVAIFFGAIVFLLRSRERLWLFYLVAVLIAPAFFLTYDIVLSAHPQPLMLRYFLVAIAMLLLCAAHVAGAMWKSGPPGRVVTVALLVCFVVAGILNTIDFYRFGRGGSSRAIARMFAESADQTITIDADNRFSSGRVVSFYAPRLAPPGRSFAFYHTDEQASAAPHPAEWIIMSSGKDIALHSKTLAHDGVVYRLDSQYPCTSLSGVPWLLYRIDIPATIRNQAASTQPADQK